MAGYTRTPETPPPAQILRKESSSHRANDAGKSISQPNQPKIETTISLAEYITDSNIRKHKKPPTPDSLNISSSNQHVQRDSKSRYQAPNHKNNIRDNQNRLPPEYITDLAPERRRCSIADEVSSSNPSKARV